MSNQIKTKKERYEFLDETGRGFYLVKHGSIVEPLYFNVHGSDCFRWWLEAPCHIRKFDGFNLKSAVDVKYLIDSGMIIYKGNVYEIDLPQVAPFLPEELEMMKITEIECLEFILNNKVK